MPSTGTYKEGARRTLGQEPPYKGLIYPRSHLSHKKSYQTGPQILAHVTFSAGKEKRKGAGY